MPQPKKNTLKPLKLGNETIGERITRIRKTRGLTQSELAEIIGITRKQVTDYETNRIHLNDDLVARFAIALKVSADELLGLTDSNFKGEPPPLKYMRRMREIDELSETSKKQILKTIDDLVKANS